MANLDASVTLKKQAFPLSQSSSGNLRCKLKNASGVVVSQADTFIGAPNVSFSGIADGSYTVSAVLIGMDGQPMGDAAESAPIEVVNVHDVDVPATVTVSLS